MADLRKSRGDQGEVTREKLLTAALDLFGRRGFDGTSTRALADAAGVNLQAIPYYFGGKEGLYHETARSIAGAIAARLADRRARIAARLDEATAMGRPIDPVEARVLLTDVVQAMAGLFVSKESEPWARFLIREQMEPTEAFRQIYGTVMKPVLDLAGRLVGVLLDEDPLSEPVRLRTVSLMGGVLVFRVAHAAALTHLDWPTIGAREAAVVADLAGDLVASIGPRERRE
ncbi:TetR family transcriptional regulator [Rhodospirillum rubrum]|uniref:DUF1956 domain-containing protein n=1 Tax=Rhodospirillum rubrum TaxID=1085 RepID=UPI00190564A4|nr:DUF1956 domain-containing protein [Rhodospirillum rubrum]MBK1663594.1 TetR family transcriptional regulator [Rhodospirillum rubrum]MBK1677397.1 TetR family transcriptional regulator [Rhodospirillum rubrum]